MKTNLKRVLSFVLVMMLVLSCVPTMAFAAEDTHTHAAQNITTGAEYDSLAEAMEAAASGDTVKVLSDSNEAVTYSEGVILDLNGHNVSNITVPADVTLTAIDSATDDYAGGFGTLSGNIAGTVASTVKTAEPKSYVSINDNGSWSFHRYYAAITAISLKPGSAALGYKAEFYGDEAVKNAVVNYGYEMWLNDYAPKALSKADKLEKNVLTLRVSNILKEGNDALNAIGSSASINGKAFITLNLNGETVTLYSAEKTTTLRGTIEAINANVAAYSETALQAVRNLCTTYAAWMIGWATENIFGVSAGEGDLNVEVIVPITAENNVLSEDAVLSYQNIVATVPAGAVLADGATELKLTIVDKASSDSDVEKQVDEALRPLDVHIEGISADNTAPIIICLGNVLPKGLNIGNYDLYHVEDGKTVAMTRANSISELDAHNEFCYDPATGAVTVAVCSFSEITLTSKAAKWAGGVDHSWYTANPNADQNTYCIYNADQLNSFAQIVGGMVGGIDQDSFSGKTVILHADLDLDDLDSENSRVFYPIGYWNNTGSFEHISGGSVSSGFYSFDGTFDGNGHTISNFYQNTWEMFGDYNDGYSGTPNYYRDGMGLFGKVNGGTVKNLTVKKFSSDGEFTTTGTIAAYADCGAKFENISIFDCNPRVYNIGNGGIVGCVGWYAKEAVNTPVTFTNITVDNSNKISALWGSWDVACGGLVGQYYPTSGQSSANYPANAGIHMENCHVAAQIDVNNDVCANYQYYAYRYAGMLIGSVRENVNGDGSALYPNTGRVYPNMNGITAENCTVHYGTWNDYYYCELVANSIASYTHDYQFSRLTQVADVDTSTLKYLPLGATEYLDIPSGRVNYVVVTGEHATENAECFHFVNGKQHFHDVADNDNPTIYETVNGETVLKENNQHIYLEFYDQLVTGYGWGVTSMGIADVPGVTVLDKLDGGSDQKFVSNVRDGAVYTSGSTISVSTLFALNSEAVVPLDEDNIQVFVSPVADADGQITSTASGIYTADPENWQNGYLTFTGSGKAQVIITDYYYCTPTVIEIEIGSTYGYRVSSVEDITAGGMFVVVAEYLDTLYAMDATPKREKLDGVEVATTIINVDGEDVEHVVVGNAVVWYAEKTTTNQITLQSGGQYVAGGTRDLSTTDTPVYWNLSEHSGGANEFLLQYEGDTDRYLSYHGENTQGQYYYFGTFHDSNMAKDEEFTFGLRFYKIADACDHTELVTAVTSPATCTEDGTMTTFCSICNTPFGTESIAALGHNSVVDEAVAATCTTDGLTEGSHCDRCGEVLVAQDVIPAGHSYDENGICTVCGDSLPVYTVTFNNNNAITSETIEQGTSLSLPALSDLEGYTFVGWVENKLTGDTTEKPVVLNGTYTPTADITLYAVYSYVEEGTSSGNGDYVKVTEAPADWSGEYVIVYESASYIFDGSLTDLDVTSNYQKVTISNNTISAAEGDPYNFTIAKNGDAYTIKSKSGYYIGRTSNSNGLNTNTTTQYSNTISISGGSVTISGAYGSLQFNKASGQTRFRYFTSTQEAIALYVKNGSTSTTYYTMTPVVCVHANVTTTTVDATCTEAGSITVTCDDCGKTISTEVIDATGHSYNSVVTDPTATEQGYTTHTCSVCGDSYKDNYVPALGVDYTVSFSVPNGIDAVADMTCNSNSSITLPDADAPEGYAFVGWVEKEITTETTTEPTVLSGEYTATDNTTLHALYSRTEAGSGSSNTYTLVTNASDLAAGDKVIIVASGYNYALSTTQNSNNRGQTVITKNGTEIQPGSNVQILTLKEGTITDTFAFYTGSGYLYAASSSNNYLRTETTVSGNSSWIISITTAGVATVTAKGTNSRNTMQYNTSGLFACYASASQKAVSIYKQNADSTVYYTTNPEVPCAHSNTTETTVDATCTAAGSVTVTCDDCGKVVSTTVIPVTEHSYNAVENAATCTENGSMVYTCGNCGDSYTEVITATGHNYVGGTCSVCGAEEPSGGETTKTYRYEKVTSAPTDWSGTYLIVYEDGKVAFNGSLSSLDATSNTISVTINNHTIESTDATNAATFTIDSNGYIKSASGYYIGQTSNANGLSSNPSTKYVNTITVNSDGTINIVSGGAYLRYNASSGQYRFRYYKSSSYSGQKAICLYKLVEE